MLEVRGLHAGYGDLPVLHGIDLAVEEGELVALVGSNAAGKSTLMRCLCGLLPLHAGEVAFENQRIDGLPAYKIADRGLAVVFEHSSIPGMSVEENLEMGAYRRVARPYIAQGLAEVYQLFPILAERRRQMATSLSGGQQQMLCVGRALMGRPRLLALDEPSVGLSPAMVTTILTALHKLNRKGMTILLVEQNVAQTLRVATRGYVIEGGAIVLQGTAAELLDNPAVKAAYLGV
jgi:branched-chain amino acid transport system ATP-binding protein